MQYRRLGRSNLQVSALCLGTMMFGDQTGRDEAAAIVADARERGVNFIDTADVYTRGASESMLGDLLAGQRHDWVLATKLGNRMSDRVNESHYSRTWMLREVEASLARLRTDHVDILYLHRDFLGMDLEEPLFALDALLRAGKIRYWGVSNFRAWRIAELVHGAARIGMPGPVVCQPYYNLLNRMPEVEILPACAHHGLGVVPYSPIARGVLTGKYLPGEAPAAGTRAGRGDRRIAETEFRHESLVLAQELKRHAEARGVTLAQFATAWVLAHRAVSAVIAGPRTLAQWQDYAPALEYTVTPEDEALVDGMVAPGHPSTPGYTDPAYPAPPRV
ncbi:aldo/keto reductase [Paracidovorax citrulli]|uniref:Aldo/keto reductase n=2 Tax=Paracidovorax citrulli TaxID=80869 RepID=A1TMG6_PARC0|nr:aldo/keto reductase [Paracidovorax citrulli]ABM32154.1 aldo/keto reductase [Paracidovorax citrulli AAC00-1]ATG94829.1 aldo/keto reductase [Paracidovorax citrulli]MVT30227.1 aldo/keto reductase [Paracidovorax citrulli]PVY66343.1 aryl-alcohol dehydrogenase-like predicted oxidoreductase [Paracidovorax citrulli]REG69485.1 aryl-alcohol dehydrogenase-like predicted oxidoreductase [Paracidovorax citrulli]